MGWANPHPSSKTCLELKSRGTRTLLTRTFCSIGKTALTTMTKKIFRVWDEYLCQYGTILVAAETKEEAEEHFRKHFASNGHFAPGEDYHAEEVTIVTAGEVE